MAQKKKSLFGSFQFMGSVKTADLVTFTREVSVLSSAGLPLIKALMSLRDQMDEGRLRIVVSHVVDGVERGDSFSESLSRFPNVFSRLYVNMIKSGEISGNLDEVLQRLATLLEKQQRLIKRVRAALIYPAFVLTMALVILSLLMIFVVPTFTKMFDEMGSDLPVPTKILINMSNMFVSYWYLIAAGVVLLCYGVMYVLKVPVCKYYFDKCVLKIPVLGKLLARVTISRLCRTLGTLFNSGVPILNALYVVKDATTNMVYAQAFPRIIDSVKEGESFALLLEQTNLFPNLVTKMVSVGEETGQLSDMLIKVADTYEEDVDVLVSSLSSLMEPLLIVIMGVIVGFIVVAMFLPLFNLTEML